MTIRLISTESTLFFWNIKSGIKSGIRVRSKLFRIRHTGEKCPLKGGEGGKGVGIAKKILKRKKFNSVLLIHRLLVLIRLSTILLLYSSSIKFLVKTLKCSWRYYFVCFLVQNIGPLLHHFRAGQQSDTVLKGQCHEILYLYFLLKTLYQGP